MKIINRTNITNALTNNYIKNETGILPMMVTNPVILVDWYHINKERSHLLDGLGIPTSSVINDDSTIVFDKIANLPVGGIDNLLIQSTYDESENGWSADYSSSGFLFANTTNVHENDYFVVTTNFNGVKRLIFKIKEHKRDYVKNMSIIEFDFDFEFDDPAKYTQLEKQVVRNFTCISSKLGQDSSFVVEENKIITLQEEIDKYLAVTEMYKDLFYDKSIGNFFYSIPIPGGSSIYLHDRVFTKILANNNILFFDPVVGFARSEYGYLNNLLVSEFDFGVADYVVNTCIIQQILNRSISDKTKKLKPEFNYLPPSIAKYQKAKMLYCDKYSNTISDKINILDFNGDYIDLDLLPIYVFDDDFISKIKTNTKYANNNLRNIIIDIYNGVEIDMDAVELEYEITADNFYLIPIIIHEYRKKIENIIN
jgi:hypothetical protein